MGPRLSTARRLALAVAYYRSGQALHLGDAAESCGLPVQDLADHLEIGSRQQLKGQKPRHVQRDVQIMRLFDSGVSKPAIARRLGLSYPAVHGVVYRQRGSLRDQQVAA